MLKLSEPITVWDSVLSPREEPVYNFPGIIGMVAGVDVTSDKALNNP